MAYIAVLKLIWAHTARFKAYKKVNIFTLNSVGCTVFEQIRLSTVLGAHCLPSSNRQLLKLEIPIIHLRRECLVSYLSLQKTNVVFFPVAA